MRNRNTIAIIMLRHRERLNGEKKERQRERHWMGSNGHVNCTDSYMYPRELMFGGRSMILSYDAIGTLALHC